MSYCHIYPALADVSLTIKTISFLNKHLKNMLYEFIDFMKIYLVSAIKKTLDVRGVFYTKPRK